MGAERIQFVDSISATAAVRLSLSTAPWKVLFNGTDVTPPPLRRSVNQTLLTDGAIIPAAAYDNRMLRLHLQLDSADRAVSATQLQALHRELDRTTNILRWQPEPTLPPVYFRTFRAPDYDPGTSDHGINLYDITLSIPAEPFALGHRVDVGTATVSNDPINTGSNGKFFDISSVQGDVETPLQIRMTGSDATGRQTLFAVRRRGTPSAMPFFLQCEAMTLGTDATTAANSASYSGAGNNNVSVSFATATLAQRLSTAAFPSSASVDARGTYRVFLRALANGGFPPSGTFVAQLRHGVRQTINKSATFTRIAALNQMQMVDLDLVQIPEGYDPGGNGPEGVSLSAAGVQLNLYMSRSSGTTAILDYLLFVPADDTWCMVEWGVSTPTTFVFDGYSRSIYGLDASSNVADIITPHFVGDPPMVSPGVTNRVVVVRDVIPQTSSADAPATTYGVTTSYWPRYLSVRPVST